MSSDWRAGPSSKVGRKGSGERGADLWGKAGLQMIATVRAGKFLRLKHEGCYVE